MDETFVIQIQDHSGPKPVTQFHIKSDGEFFFKGMVVGHDPRIAERIQTYLGEKNALISELTRELAFFKARIDDKKVSKIETAYQKFLEEQAEDQS